MTRQWLTPWVLGKDGQWRRSYRVREPLNPSSLLPSTVEWQADGAWVYGIVAGPKVDDLVHWSDDSDVLCENVRCRVCGYNDRFLQDIDAIRVPDPTGNEGQRGITEADRERDTYRSISLYDHGGHLTGYWVSVTHLSLTPLPRRGVT